MNPLENYHILMDSLDPQNPPVVRFVHCATPRQSKHIGVLDASFNPLTLAHEALINYAQNAFNFDEIVLLLAKTNVDKALFGATLGQRLAMMVNYVDSGTPLDTHLSIAGCSHARFIDKAHALRAHYSLDIQIYFLVGHDTLIRIFDPHYYTDMPADLKILFSLCHIVSANRANPSREIFHKFMSRPKCAPFANRVHPLQLPPSFGNISSTEVRKRIRAGDPITDLVPESIAQFIETFDLYRE